MFWFLSIIKLPSLIGPTEKIFDLNEFNYLKSIYVFQHRWISLNRDCKLDSSTEPGKEK